MKLKQIFLISGVILASIILELFVIFFLMKSESPLWSMAAISASLKKNLSFKFEKPTFIRRSASQENDESDPNPAILDKSVFFSATLTKPLRLLPLEDIMYDEEFIFELMDEGKTLTCTTDVSNIRLDKKSKKSPSIISWKFISDAPILSRPKVFKDAVVFIDGMPNLVILDIQTGAIRKTVPSPVLPSGKAEGSQSQYQFEGLDEKKYAFNFLYENKESQSSSFTMDNSLFDLDSVFQSKILIKLENWHQAFVNQAVTMDENYISPIFKNIMPLFENSVVELKNIDSVPRILGFTPNRTQKYSILIGDSKKKVKKYPAFVAVFSSEGELLASSLNTVSTNPTVNIMLDSTKFYYFAFGLLAPLTENDTIYAVIFQDSQ
ncbi:MAG: hypothetical protein ACRC5H_05540 [Treponemataceae bacterium]